MAVRSSMGPLITKARLMIADPLSTTSFFEDQDIQDAFDDGNRDDIRYELATIAPTIVNAASTGNQATTIFADYYSTYRNWETDIVLQGVNITSGAAWIVLSPLASDFITGHFQFELTPFVNGTAPGQYPPVFLTGKTYDLFGAAADLLEFWAAALAGSYDITVDGQSLRRSQLMQAKITMANLYRRKAKAKSIAMVRTDVAPELGSRRMRLLDAYDNVRGLS